MFSKLTRLGLAGAMLLSLLALGAGTAFATNPAACDPVANCTIEDFVAPDMTSVDYWNTRLGLSDCVKVDTTDTPITTDKDYAFLAIHSGNWMVEWSPAPAGTYSATTTTSFYIACGQGEEDQQIQPAGSILGPCADPAYYAVFDNSASNVDLKFRMTWFNTHGFNVVSKLVPAGAVYTTFQHWSKPGTMVKVSYKDPNTGLWTKLASLTAVKGSFPACDYTPGFQQPV